MNRLLVVCVAGVLVAADWPTWRGPNGDGIIRNANVPTVWADTRNVAWKTPVRGQGHSSPIVSNGRVFLTAFDPATTDRLLLAFDAVTGREEWCQRVLTAAPEKMHKNNTPASSTPVADGRHVWVTFLDGDRVAVASYDFAGRKSWLQHPGGFRSQHGFCGTPVLYNDTVLVNGDNDGDDAFVAALDRTTGQVRWKIPRPNRTRSFSVPVLLDVDGRTQLVLAGSKTIVGLDPATGKLIWQVDSPTDKFVATVVAGEGLVFATGTSPVSTLTAIDPRGQGNVTTTHVKWKDGKTAAYVPSPVAFRDRLFVLADSGIATLLDAKSGRLIWSERLPGRLYHASPLLVDDRLFCLATDGTATILAASDTFEVVRSNRLGDDCHATPAVAGERLYIRDGRHLWCIKSDGPSPR